MSKEQIAEKLGWKYESHWMGEYYETGWILPNSKIPIELPDWENSLDAQARDIWGKHWDVGIGHDCGGWWICRIHVLENDGSSSTHDGCGDTPAQACWKAICEVML